jgi:autotransporter-associated beta strand protein
MKAHTDNPIAPPSVSLRSRLGDFLVVAAAILLLLTSARGNAGILAEWQANPLNGNWNNSANWSPAAPNGPSDSAFFEPSSITNVSISANTEVASIVFDSGASAFTITASPALTLTISGNGISNNSGITQNFVTAVNGAGATGEILFTNSATAGSMTAFTNNGGAASGAGGGVTGFFGTSTAGSGTINNNGGTVQSSFGGETVFQDTSTAGSATINNNNGGTNGAGLTLFENTSTAGSATVNNNAGTVGGGGELGGSTEFFNSSTAGSATITNNGALGAAGGLMKFFGDDATHFSTAGSATINNNGGAVLGATAGSTEFFNSSTAGSATINNNGSAFSDSQVFNGNGGRTQFIITATADSATLVANGGTGEGGSIQFFNDSLGGTSTVKVYGNGNLDISSHNPGSVTIGFVGPNNLTVGSNNLSKTFSGVISEIGGSTTSDKGSLTKTGKGKLSLTKANTYSGATTVNGGTLLVKNKTGSGAGAGAVQVNAGTLGGVGGNDLTLTVVP